MILLIPVLLLLAQFALQYLKQVQTSLIALEADTGRVAWSVPLGENQLGENQSLAVFTAAQSDRVFVGMATDIDESDTTHHKRYEIKAYRAASGQKLWTFSPTLSEPYRAEDMAFELPLSIQAETLWLNLLLESAPKGPVSDPNIATQQSEPQIAPLPNIRKGQVIAIDTITGQPRWTVDRDWNIDIPDHSGLASSNDRSAILRITPTQKIWLETYQTSTGKKLWQTQMTPPKWEKVPSNLYKRYQLFANSNMIFVFNNHNRRIEAYDWETGKLKSEISIEMPPSKLAVSDSTLYNRSYTRVEAYNPSTGSRRWRVDLANPDQLKCLGIQDIKPVSNGVYIVCRGRQNRPIVRLSFLDAQTGHEQWTEQFYDRYYRDGLPIGPRSFAVFLEDTQGRSEHRLATFVRDVRESDRELWSWQPEYWIRDESFSTADNRVFMLGEVPRWQNLKSNLKSKFNNRFR